MPSTPSISGRASGFLLVLSIALFLAQSEVVIEASSVSSASEFSGGLFSGGIISRLFYERPKYAWVTMALHFNKSGNPGDFYRVHSLAASINKHSEYPLLVLTDPASLDPSPSFRKDMMKLGVQFLNITHMEMPERLRKTLAIPRWASSWDKLQVFNITGWDRLVWVDLDGILSRSMDHLFSLDGIWAQGDNFYICEYAMGMSTGVISFTPNASTFQAMMDYADTLDRLDMGSRELIHDYFVHTGQSVNFLSWDEASYGHCWNPDEADPVPGFINKPSGQQECLDTLALLNQGKDSNLEVLDVCVSSSLSGMWRNFLCSAVSNDVQLNAFCQEAPEAEKRVNTQTWFPTLWRRLAYLKRSFLRITAAVVHLR